MLFIKDIIWRFDNSSRAANLQLQSLFGRLVGWNCRNSVSLIFILFMKNRDNNERWQMTNVHIWLHSRIASEFFIFEVNKMWNFSDKSGDFTSILPSLFSLTAQTHWSLTTGWQNITQGSDNVDLLGSFIDWLNHCSWIHDGDNRHQQIGQTRRRTDKRRLSDPNRRRIVDRDKYLRSIAMCCVPTACKRRPNGARSIPALH